MLKSNINLLAMKNWIIAGIMFVNNFMIIDLTFLTWAICSLLPPHQKKKKISKILFRFYLGRLVDSTLNKWQNLMTLSAY